MNILIYLIIALLFCVLILWTWNNTKDYESAVERIKYTVIGTIVIFLITLIYFTISKIGITYPKPEMVKEVRKMTTLLLTPINGFLSLPHIAIIKTQIKQKIEENEKIKRKVIILAIILAISTLIEIIYMKDFQKGIIQMLNSK